MVLNHGIYDFDVLLNDYVSGAAKDLEIDKEYKFNWKSFGYYCLENYPEFIREEVLQDYNNGEPNVIDSLFCLALDHAHYIDFADFEFNDHVIDRTYSKYRALQKGVSKEDLPKNFFSKPSKRYDTSILMNLISQHSITDLSIDDAYLNRILDGMTSTTERKFIDSQRYHGGE